MSRSRDPVARSAAARRLRARLLQAGVLVTLAAATVLLWRRDPGTYTPGEGLASDDAITKGLARDAPPDLPRVRFEEAAASAGIRFRHFSGRRSTQLPEDMGSGAAWGDYDGDGDPDLYLVNADGPLDATESERAASPAAGALFRNDGDGRFTDVTAEAGVGTRGCGMGAAWGDFDDDGDLDLAVTRFGTIVLYRNDGGRFADVSKASGVGSFEGFWAGASWADADRDGDLDLYVAGYVRYRRDASSAGRVSTQYKAQVPFTLNPSSYPPERNLLFRNEGGRFREIGARAGVDNPTGRSLSAAWADFDADGWPDLYVANDVSDNALFHNRGDGTFEDWSHSAWVADPRGAMGLAIGDWNGDGDRDIFITHWIAQENALFDSQERGAGGAPGGHRFLDVADQVGLGQIALDFVGWGTTFLDYDNDGRPDLFVANGSTFQREDDPSRLVPMRNQLFWNAGADRGFFEAGASGGEAFAVENVGRGAAVADYDGDGDEDVVVTVNGGAARLLRNEGGSAQGWMRVVLRSEPRRLAGGSAKTGRGAFTTPTFANGAVVTVVAGGSMQTQEIGSQPSYLSQMPAGEAHFGLGAARAVERLEIAWPDGRKDVFRDLPVRATVRIVEGSAPAITAGKAESVGEGPRASDDDPAPAVDRAAVLRFWSTLDEATATRTRGDCAAAVPLYRRALGIDPRHEDALYYLGQCALSAGDAAAAAAAFGRLISVNVASARGHLALGALLASGGPGVPVDLDGADREFRSAHAINGEETGPMLRLGEIALVRGDDREARRWLESALRTNPKCVEAAFLLGFQRWRDGDRAGARDDVARARRAAAIDAPIQGVLSEGDRKPPNPATTAPHGAPPQAGPAAATLFSSAAAVLRGKTVGSGASMSELDALYEPVARSVQQMRRRSVPSRTPAGAGPGPSAR
jgi:Flp pilus assembly protein TadD